MTDVRQKSLPLDDNDPFGEPVPPGLPPDFEARLGEPVAGLFDMGSWHSGPDMSALYTRLAHDQTIAEAIAGDAALQAQVRREILPHIKTRKNAPPNAGVYSVPVRQIERAHRDLLFNGVVQVADGTMTVHDSSIVSIAQIGVCLASYQGNAGTWGQQLFRRDLSVGPGDVYAQMVETLEERQERGVTAELNGESWGEFLGRKLMAYAERAVLLRQGGKGWVMGHGHPAPYELLTGASDVRIMEASIALLRLLILGHRKFVFVPSKVGDFLLETIGQALRPGQFAIVDTARVRLEQATTRANYTGLGPMPRAEAKLVREFIHDAGDKIVRGVYRASAVAPAHIFYAHVDYAREAGLIALADSTLQTDRGFPLLIDLADRVCRATFEPASFHAIVQQAYTRAGQPLRYASERETRKG